MPFMQMQTVTGTDIQEAARLLRQDEIVAIPTETVYGLAGNALSETALVKIYEAKQRPRFNPLILHLPDVTCFTQYARMDAVSNRLASTFMPGPFTLLLPKNTRVPDLATAGSDKVALRVPAHPVIHRLLKLLDFPLAAPSANPFGYVSPTSAAHVLSGLGGKIPYILDGGTCQVGLESTIAEVLPDKVLLHRAGAVSAQDIRHIAGMPVEAPIHQSRPDTPGQLKSHYATHTPLYRGDIPALLDQFPGKRIALLLFQEIKEVRSSPHISQFVLSPAGDLAEAAQHLFATMRRIDSMGFDLVIADYFPDTGIGRAINDRLERAKAVYKTP